MIAGYSPARRELHSSHLAGYDLDVLSSDSNKSP